jgi:DTW domain-containing protein YfiP
MSSFQNQVVLMAYGSYLRPATMHSIHYYLDPINHITPFLNQSMEKNPPFQEDYYDVQQHRKRFICDRCKRPSPKACICAALPQSPVVLSKCRVLCLVHPLELCRKNRSLPLIELCLHDHTHPQRSLPPDDNDDNWTFYPRVGRKVHLDPWLLHFLHSRQDGQYMVLVFPSRDSISLADAMECIRRDRRTHNSGNPRITLLFIDATWKYAKEIDQACSDPCIWPKHVIRVHLSDQDRSQVANYHPNRFHIRTPPTENHLSTAESIAIVLSVMEDKPNLYDVLMKPLDLMVAQWHG